MRSHCTAGIAAVANWLTPQVWKMARQADPRKREAQRWKIHPLVMVCVLVTWTAGDSEAERFASARAFYVARHRREKRPGQSFQGFQQALSKLPLAVLHALFKGLRCRLTQLYSRVWYHDDFVPIACDGSRLECPRSAELEKRLDCCSKEKSAPMLQVTALVMLPMGLLWSWSVGPGTSSEHDQLRQLLPTLPRDALLVADACYLGYDLYSEIIKAKADFLVRGSSRMYLYTEERQPLKHFREGIVYFWPQKLQKAGLPPLRLRLLRIRPTRKKSSSLWLLTSVLENERLNRQQAAELYRWRWHIEGTFRTYKRTLPKVKLWSRTEAMVYREAELSLLALQLLTLQRVGKRFETAVRDGPSSPRQALLILRGEMTVAIGAELGPRQQRGYRVQLARVHRGGKRKKTRRKWPRRKNHTPPKPPRMRVMSKRLKAKLQRKLPPI
jgi:hypothetical protein